MRNLKRVLSLALAVMMLIGMMVVGANAANIDDFSDKDEIVNKDAVSMLTVLGVINGKEDGSYFDPTGDVTRAEMAKMIATILNQGADVNDLYASMNTGLTDISDSWAKGYINYCYSLGIIAGRGDGRFDPTAPVTGNEAAKMLLVAIGYNPDVEGLTGSAWAIKTTALASTLGIFDDMTASTSANLSRDNAALMIYNALDVEMIQSYTSNGFALVYGDHRTLLSTKYGVYKVEGVVVGNEYAQLQGTNSDAALANDKTTLDDVKVYKSTTSNTITGEYEKEINPVTFNVETSADMLGQTVTMYIKKTTVLSNSTVLGIYLNDASNTVVTSNVTEGNMTKEFLKGTGLSLDKNTAYYVNYGAVGSETAAYTAMSFGAANTRFDTLTDNANAYGVELKVIDNNGDGVVDYVLWMQEALSQVSAVNATKETTNLYAYNSNKAIDNADIVTDLTLAEGDLVLVSSYGGKYYVSAPEIVTGKMEAYNAKKATEQTITIDGTVYNPSYIVYKAAVANNTYEFDITECDDNTSAGVDFDKTYNFVLDSHGNVIAYQPVEEGLYNYALVINSGYEPGAFASDASGKVKVLLPDGTTKTFVLDFDASAKNLGKQLNITGTNAQIAQLKGFLGTADSDNSSTAPWNGAASGFVGRDIVGSGDGSHADDYPDDNAAGYVIAYALNSDETELTIKYIVGSNDASAVALNTTRVDDATPANDIMLDDEVTADYITGAARVQYTGSNYLTLDKNTIAFYYDEATDEYGVAVGYNEMADLDATPTHVDFVADRYVKNGTVSSLAQVVLYNAEGPQAELDYLYVMQKSKVDSEYAELDVVKMDGTVGKIKITRSDYNTIFTSPADFEMAYAYSTDANGITELTAPVFSSSSDADSNNLGGTIVRGYAEYLTKDTIMVYDDERMRNTDYFGTYACESNIWNVEDLDIEGVDKAPATSFSDFVGREVVLVLDSDCKAVRAAYVERTLTETGSGTTIVGDFGISDYVSVTGLTGVAPIKEALEAGKNVRVVGDLVLDANLVIPEDRTVLVEGDLTSSTTETVGNLGTLKVKGSWTTSGAQSTIHGDVVLADLVLRTHTTIAENAVVSLKDVSGYNASIGITGTGKHLTVDTGAKLYVNEGTGDINIGTGTLTNDGHMEWKGEVQANGVVDTSSNSMIGNKLTAITLTVTSGKIEVSEIAANTVTISAGGAVTVSDKITDKAGTGDAAITVSGSSSSLDASGADVKADITTEGGASVDVDDDVVVANKYVIAGKNGDPGEYKTEGPYKYTAKMSFDGDTVTLTYTGDYVRKAVFDDVSRFLGAMYEELETKPETLVFDGDKFAWDAAATLKGSHWYLASGGSLNEGKDNIANRNTLIYYIFGSATEGATISEQKPASIALTIDGTPVNFNIVHSK